MGERDEAANPMKTGSLFSGIGGLELGLEQAGMTTVFQVEIDPYCQRVLARHWPQVPRHHDVTTFPTWWETNGRPHCDLICAGFPCQPFSLAGKQLGLNDERWMWPATRDAIRAVGPSYVLLENVSALVRDSGAFGTILRDLHTIGFDAEWATLRASDFGAPHSRERVYVLAYATSVDGEPRIGMGASGDGRASLTARGLSGLAVPERRQRAREWLEREPRVDRLVDGVPFQVDRLRVAGNAVVPAVAEHIGRLILAHAAEQTRRPDRA
jgi:DNA (cytosine-5)-methyltransferase 1